MADLIPARGGERGQLLLIAAFIIATSFVVLALVVNSAIFTENLATRDDVAGSQDALQHRHEVEQSVGAVVEEVNEDNALGLSDAKAQIEDINRQGGMQQSVRGRVVKIEYDSRQDGVKIAQDEVGNFSNTTGFVPDWTVAEDVTNTRNFQINLTDYSELQTAGNAFQIVVNGSSNDEWTVTIAENGSVSGTVDILVDRPGLATQRCTREFDEFLRIDITGAVVGEEPCVALDRHSSGTPLWFGSGVDAQYRIDFENPGEIEGTYSLIVDEDATPHSFLATDPPYADTDAIYELTVAYSYHTTAVGYETDIRVAPGEAPP